MVGIGVTPEGIHNSYPMYDLMLENGWRQRPVEDVDEWFRMFSRRRYGPLNSGHMETAWKMVRARLDPAGNTVGYCSVAMFPQICSKYRIIRHQIIS